MSPVVVTEVAAMPEDSPAVLAVAPPPSLRLTPAQVAQAMSGGRSVLRLAPAGGSGPPGPAGPAGPAELTYPVVVDDDVNALDVLVVEATGQIKRGTSLVADHGARVIGVAATAARAGEQVTVVAGGALPTPGPMPLGTLYLGPDGALTGDPNTGVVQLNVAYAYTATNVRVRIGTPIYHGPQPAPFDPDA